QAAAARANGPGGAGGGQHLRGVLQRLVGSDHVGDAGRDVPQPDPRFGPGGGGPGAMGGELHHHLDLPDAAGRDRPGGRLRPVRDGGVPVGVLRAALRPRDEGPRAGTDGGLTWPWRAARSPAQPGGRAGGATESRITSWWSTTWSTTSCCSVWMLRSRMSMAVLDMLAIGWRMVVSSGHTVVAAEVSSQPTTDRSRGTSSPLRCATETTAAAMSSLLAKMAVGRFLRASSFSAAARPDR